MTLGGIGFLLTKIGGSLMFIGFLLGILHLIWS